MNSLYVDGNKLLELFLQAPEAPTPALDGPAAREDGDILPLNPIRLQALGRQK